MEVLFISDDWSYVVGGFWSSRLFLRSICYYFLPPYLIKEDGDGMCGKNICGDELKCYNSFVRMPL